MTDLKRPSLSARPRRLGIGLFTEGARYFSGWIAAVIVLAVAVPMISARFQPVDLSAWYVAANSGKFFTAIVAAIFLYTIVPIMVAQGLTRGELATAFGWFGLLWSTGLGALAVVGFLGEHALYTWFDWNQVVQWGGTDTRLHSVDEVLGLAVRYPALYLMYFAVGALIGAALYRWSGGWLVLAGTAPVAFAIDNAMLRAQAWGPGWLRAVTGFGERLDTLGAAAALVVVVVLGAWIARRILIGTPIRGKRA